MFKFTDTAGKNLIVKMIPFSTRDIMEIRKILKNKNMATYFDHPNILKTYQAEIVIQQEKRDFWELGTLEQYVQSSKELSIEKSIHIFRQICKAVKVIHDANVVHKNLTPGSILLNEKLSPILFDFSQSFILEKKQRGSYCKSEYYMAPEMYEQEKLGKEIDIWSLGIMLYFLVYRVVSFQGKTMLQTYQKMLKMKIKYSSLIDQDINQLIAQMIQLEPGSRLSIEQVLDSKVFTKNLKKDEISSQQVQNNFQNNLNIYGHTILKQNGIETTNTRKILKKQIKRKLCIDKIRMLNRQINSMKKPHVHCRNNSNNTSLKNRKSLLRSHLKREIQKSNQKTIIKNSSDKSIGMASSKPVSTIKLKDVKNFMRPTNIFTQMKLDYMKLKKQRKLLSISIATGVAKKSKKKQTSLLLQKLAGRMLSKNESICSNTMIKTKLNFNLRMCK